jgi:hypothetical protein
MTIMTNDSNSSDTRKCNKNYSITQWIYLTHCTQVFICLTGLCSPGYDVSGDLTCYLFLETRRGRRKEKGIR